MRQRETVFREMNAEYAFASIERELKSSELDSWTLSNQIIKRDGYEIYYTEHAIELTRKHPESLAEQLLFRISMDIASPMFVAFVKYVMNNPEDVTRTAIAQHVGEIE